VVSLHQVQRSCWLFFGAVINEEKNGQNIRIPLTYHQINAYASAVAWQRGGPWQRPENARYGLFAAQTVRQLGARFHSLVLVLKYPHGPGKCERLGVFLRNIYLLVTIGISLEIDRDECYPIKTNLSLAK